MRLDVATPRMSKARMWLRVCRPLLMWLVIFLVALAYTGHQHLLQQTRLLGSVLFDGKDIRYAAKITLDGRTFEFGQRVFPGRHQLVIECPKTDGFRTNLFMWYGEHNLGSISLPRSKGMLSIKATPAAKLLTIRGPEFAVTLTNTPGITVTVPTDRYLVEAVYARWKREEEAVVLSGQTTIKQFDPKLGVLRIKSSHPDVTYQLRTSDRRVMESGPLPATVAEVPEGSYQLISKRKDDEREMTVAVKAGQTNVATVEYVYGLAFLETDPPGARVMSAGRDYGTTPLTLPELRPGSWQFSLRLTDYDLATGSLTVAVNRTNNFRTNLVSRYYTMAMEKARRSYAEKDFDRATEAATEALKHKSDDLAAKDLERDATGHAHLKRAETLAQRGDYTSAINEVNLGLASLPEKEKAKALLADYTNREQQRIEAEKKREAELAEEQSKRREQELAEQQARERISQINEAFNKLSRGYENTAAFKQHELTATNLVGAVATAINNAFASGQPPFQVVRYDLPRPDMFTLQTRQRIGIGYRECLIVGGQVRENQTRIMFKVFEYEHLPDLNLLGGLLKLTGDIKITSQDPKVAKEKAERFQVRTKEGVEVVKGRIQGAIGQ